MKMNGVELNFEHLVEILLKKLTLWLEDGVAMLPNIVIAILVTTLFFLLGRMAQKVVRHALNRISANRTITSLVSGAVQIMVTGLGVFMALGVLNLDKAVASLLAGVGVLGLAIGFAFQEIASNFISGIFIAIIKPFNLGDVVEVKGTSGTVDDISLRTTSLLTDDGQQVDIPNKDMFTSQLKNYTSNRKQRITISFHISYKSDFVKARDIATLATKALNEKFPSPKSEVFFSACADLGAKLTVYYWVPVPTPYSSMQLTNDLIVTIKNGLQQNQIIVGSNSSV
jgi:small conductance mechanosensitive channel